MARLERLRVFPVKGFDGIDVETSDVLDGGTLRYDREFALFDTEGSVCNGKQLDGIHELTTDFDPDSGTFYVETPDGDTEQFDITTDTEPATEWLGDYFDRNLTLKRDASLGFVDRRRMGPSVISTATLETVASWFEEMTVESARRRLRANVEISGVPAFWEDRFVGDGAPAFEVDGVRFEGVTPCGRCVVPQRDPDTGEPLPEFQKMFIRNREETFPDWADETAFDHYYTLMIITSIAESDRGQTLRVGDDVDIIE